MASSTVAQNRPPASPPAEWGPISINLEEIEYPYPVHYFNLRLFGQDVRIAYMDVPPAGRANGQTMVMGGEQDGPTFPEDARRAAETIPGAQLVLFPDAGHNPHEELPHRVNEELIRFLTDGSN